MSDFFKQKHIHAWFVQLTGFIAVFTGKMTGSEYVALSTLALTAYATAVVMDKKLNGIPPNP